MRSFIVRGLWQQEHSRKSKASFVNRTPVPAQVQCPFWRIENAVIEPARWMQNTEGKTRIHSPVRVQGKQDNIWEIFTDVVSNLVALHVPSWPHTINIIHSRRLTSVMYIHAKRRDIASLCDWCKGWNIRRRRACLVSHLEKTRLFVMSRRWYNVNSLKQYDKVGLTPVEDRSLVNLRFDCSVRWLTRSKVREVRIFWSMTVSQSFP